MPDKYLGTVCEFSTMDRRAFLACASLTTVAGIAGCTGSADESEDGVIMPRVELGNATNDTQTFHLLVEYDGEFEHWNSYDVEPSLDSGSMGSELIDPGLPDEPGEVVVYVRIGDRRARIDFADDGYGDGECVLATFLYGFRGDNRISAHPMTLADDEDLAAELDCPGETS